MKCYAPLKYSIVSNGIYRSAYPSSVTYTFIQTLGLKSMICIHPNDLKDQLRQYCHDNHIELKEYDIGINKEPFLNMNNNIVKDAIEYSLNVNNHPVLIFSTKGSNQLSCFIGCIRKAQGWCISSIILEYTQFCEDDSNSIDYQYITNFKI